MAEQGSHICGLSPSGRRRRYLAARRVRERVVQVRACFGVDECERVLEALRRALRRGARAREATDAGGGDVADVDDALVTGWTAGRHADFSTTDLPVSALSTRAQVWVRRAVRERVLGLFAARAGLDPADLFLKDLFLVLYDATQPGAQTSLALHRDGCLFSFNVLINEAADFTGGGTVFPALGAVRAARGDCVIHDAKVLHGGAEVTAGRRVVLVGFVDSVPSETPSFGEARGEARLRRDEMELRALRERLARPRRASAGAGAGHAGSAMAMAPLPDEEQMIDLIKVFSIGGAATEAGPEQNECEADGDGEGELAALHLDVLESALESALEPAPAALHAD
jgi:hypothetical protein